VKALSDHELDAFVEKALAFLDEHATRRTESARAWGTGPDAIPLLEGSNPDTQMEELASARRWRRLLFEHGYGWLSGPAAYGGAELHPVLDDVFFDLQRGYELPDMSYFGQATRMLGPTIYSHGSDELRRRYLTSLYNGDLVACQLFSEPGAGSDLASARSSAVRDGDDWIVNGQKVWSSFAHVAEVGELLVRTDPAAPKHRGLTMFVVPMDTPGIDVRPLRQMTGSYSFNEVFLDDVRVSDANRIGEVGEGWKVAVATLNSERGAVGARLTNPDAQPLARLLHLALTEGADRGLLDRVAEIVCEDRVVDLLNAAARERLVAGIEPGSEGAITKLKLTQNLTRIAEVSGDLLGPAMSADTGRWGTYAWSEFACSVPGMRLAGGTDEILLSLVGERLLGLPRDPRA
jgi:acyl-CoA dehydrogenase